MKRNGGINSIILVSLCAVLCLWPSDPATAATLVPKARIVATEGDIAAKYKGTDDFVSVWRYDRVSGGDAIRTGGDGSAELVFGDGSLVVLGPSGTLTVEAIEPSRTASEAGTGDRIVVTVRARLEGGRVRLAVGAGSLMALSAGFVSIATDPATGADFTYAADVFSMGYYLRVDGGCVFLFLRDSRVVPVCGKSRVIVGMFADRVTPLLLPDPSTDSIALGFAEETPTIVTHDEVAHKITVNRTETMRSPDGLFLIPIKETVRQEALTIGGNVDAGRAVLISINDGTNWLTVAPDETGRWEYDIERPPPRELRLIVKSVYVGPPPAMEAAAPEVPSSPGAAPPPPEGSPDEIATRFVQELAGALERKDTSALSWLISADYSGVVGGSSRSAFLRAAGDYFRSGGAISLSATVGGALSSGEGVIVTMAFAARSDTTTKAGSIKLWLSPEGTLTHAEGEWIF